MAMDFARANAPYRPLEFGSSTFSNQLTVHCTLGRLTICASDCENTGSASKHTHDHAGIRVVFWETIHSLEEAVQRERQLKGWSRAKKMALIAGHLEELRALSRSRS
jgi:hypothetical protein